MDRVESIARVLAKHARDGGDVGDLLGAACSLAAARLGGPEELVDGRPGSWEAAHVVGLAGGWEYVDPAVCGPVRGVGEPRGRRGTAS